MSCGFFPLRRKTEAYKEAKAGSAGRLAGDRAQPCFLIPPGTCTQGPSSMSVVCKVTVLRDTQELKTEQNKQDTAGGGGADHPLIQHTFTEGLLSVGPVLEARDTQ